MIGAHRKTALSLALAFSMVGCAGNIHVFIPPHEGDAESALGRVPPTRVGASARLAPGLAAGGSREAAFGVPLGNVSFAPGAASSIRQVLEAELLAAGHDLDNHLPAVAFVAYVKRFAVRSDTTLLYWDVVGDVAMELAPTASLYEAECVERTYVNPDETLIAALMASCLDEIGKQFRSDARVADALAKANRE